MKRRAVQAGLSAGQVTIERSMAPFRFHICSTYSCPGLSSDVASGYEGSGLA